MRSNAMNIARLSAKPDQGRDREQLSRARRSRSPSRVSAPRRAGPATRRTTAIADETERAAPGDERERLHAGVVGEPRQRPEHPEQRRGDDDDGEADRRRTVGDGQRGAPWFGSPSARRGCGTAPW